MYLLEKTLSAIKCVAMPSSDRPRLRRSFTQRFTLVGVRDASTGDSALSVSDRMKLSSTWLYFRTVGGDAGLARPRQ